MNSIRLGEGTPRPRSTAASHPPASPPPSPLARPPPGLRVVVRAGWEARMNAGNAAVAVNGPSRLGRPDPDRIDRRALAALGHPFSLAAAALLLLNDHVLKRAFPSILTGKVSDFAGLFFFPFLLAVFVGWMGQRARRPRGAEAAMAACFVVTASCFALVKIDPASNVLAVRLLETALGVPVRIVRDPTDLIALAALWPAWRLWRRLDERRGGNTPRSLLALRLAALAALATG